jgi:hypothetical protein
MDVRGRSDDYLAWYLHEQVACTVSNAMRGFLTEDEAIAQVLYAAGDVMQALEERLPTKLPVSMN